MPGAYTRTGSLSVTISVRVTWPIFRLRYIHWSSISIHTCLEMVRSTLFQSAVCHWIWYQVHASYDEQSVCIVRWKRRQPIGWMLVVSILCTTVGMTRCFLQLCNIIHRARQYQDPLTNLCRAFLWNLSWNAPTKLAHSQRTVMTLAHQWIARPSWQFQNLVSQKVRKSTPSVTIECSSLQGRAAVVTMRKALRKSYIGYQILVAGRLQSFRRHGVARCAMCTISRGPSPHPMANPEEVQAGCTLLRCVLTRSHL